ncbi:MAG TPA: DUF885 domain-containing protein, partial [Gammaproteobacteria bacterium]|nr:DUF885 domain-containing protein [Gammaproteobacteria bacterium]
MKSKTLMLAVACAISGVALSATAAAPQTPAWVAESNQDAQIVLKTFAEFAPEQAGQFGVDGLDAQATNLPPDVIERFAAAADADVAQLTALKAKATDPHLKQDLQILTDAIAGAKRDNDLQHKYLLNFTDVPQLVFQGVRSLIDPQVPEGRQQAVVQRMQAYAGMLPGRPPITAQARALFEADLKRPGLIGPYKGEIEQDLQDQPQYVAGIKDLLSKSKVTGWEPAYAKLETQLNDYIAWEKSDVLPRCRDKSTLPEEIYANNLKDLGVYEDPRALITEAEFSFSEIQHQMDYIAAQVAKEHGYKSSDYRDVIRELKKQQLVGDAMLPFYKNRLGQIEAIIREQHIATLPQRDMVIRMGSAAETAQQPAPHMNAPRLIGNTGQYGEFVLPLMTKENLGNPMQEDDDSFDAAAWTLTAHEGRPGHELQFASMIENGTSIARAVFAFNSANVEGWALYSEAEMQPYEPLDGQLIALRDRLLRAARAFLDPMVNLGMITPDDVKAFLMREVVASPAMAKEEADRFSFRAPGQATSYYYGYHNLMTMRGEAEVALGPKFNRQKFNDFILSQGLLPPTLLQQAIEQEFIP